ncbi:120.7 kDa protein in NOF-FB transposable element, partial [Frankliniella fusca]
GQLRNIKYQANRRRKLDSKSVISSIEILKYSDQYTHSIFDVGSDPFFVHYFLPQQMRVYNSYAERSLYCRVIIDASGKIVTKIERPVERHNANAITYWMREWIRHGAALPQEIVIDFSAALLLALCLTFASYVSGNA